MRPTKPGRKNDWLSMLHLHVMRIEKASRAFFIARRSPTMSTKAGAKRSTALAKVFHLPAGMPGLRGGNPQIHGNSLRLPTRRSCGVHAAFIAHS
jgi:hypothetical protein